MLFSSHHIPVAVDIDGWMPVSSSAFSQEAAWEQEGQGAGDMNCLVIISYRKHASLQVCAQNSGPF